jgi:hypothetical protein
MRVELTDIEKLLLPLVVTSRVGAVKRMVYKAIRKYQDLSVPASDESTSASASRYFSRVEIGEFLNMVRKNENIKIDKNFEQEDDEALKKVTKDEILKDLIKQQKEAKTNADKLKATGMIASIQGYTRNQQEKMQSKSIYVPMECHECPLYKEKQGEIME